MQSEHVIISNNGRRTQKTMLTVAQNILSAAGCVYPCHSDEYLQWQFVAAIAEQAP